MNSRQQGRAAQPVLNLWRHAILAVLVAGTVLLGALHATVWSLVDTWLNAETYTHGFLILPISLWLVWQKRAELRLMRPRPAAIVLLLLAATLVLWALAELVGVQVVEQVALVAALILAVWAVVGHRVACYLSFPLLFLFLGVPMGEDLVPSLMEFTATFTVKMLQLTGIPVYREGLHFVIPSGSWSVVEACSGVRYLIASVTLGFLYAYLSYASLWRRLLFIALSAIVPILANGIRAYLIVMIGHLSNMQLAVGIDHLIYGWLFFGLVMLLLFWIGSFWREPHPAPDQAADVIASQAGRTDPVRFYTVAALVGGLSLLTVVATGWLEQRSGSLVATLAAPEGLAGWTRSEGLPAWNWQPQTLQADQQLSATYRRGEQEVAVLAMLYPTQRQDAEAVNSGNQVLGRDSDWRVTDQGQVSVAAAGIPETVNSFELRAGRGALASDARALRVWQWYRLGARSTANSYLGKFYAAMNLLYPGRSDGAYVLLAAMDTPGAAAARQTLGAFAADMGAALDGAFERTVVAGAGPRP